MKKNPGTESARWLAQAEEEFKDAAALKDMGRFYLSLYLCQQCAEKALKAFIYLNIDEPLFSHSVSTLLKLATEIDPGFGDLKGARRLDDYYIPTRYPNGLPGEIPARYYTDPDEAAQALSWSGQIIELVRNKLV